MTRNGAQILIDTLIDLGVTSVFGYPGGAVLDIYDELYRASDKIDHILTAHEQGAAHAADGYARVTGKTGVVLATSGPGATNLVTGIANAYLDSVPLIAITGNVATPLLGRDSFQEVDIVGITQPIVKHSYLVRDVNRLEATLQEAFHLAATGRPGPVLIDIPKSVQSENATDTTKEEDPLAENDGAKGVQSHPELLAEALKVLESAKRPFLYFGGGILSSNAEAEAAALAERLAAPVGLSMMGLTVLPHTHPLNLGMVGMHGQYAAAIAQSKADVILAAGVRFSDRATGDVHRYAAHATVVHVDIDPAEIGKNVSPHIGLAGDTKEIFTALLDALPQQTHEEWLAEVEADKAVVRPEENPAAFVPRAIIRALADSLPQDTVIATDVGQHQIWVMQHYPFTAPRTLLTSGGLGTMGYGLGAAIGGSVALGGRRTVLFTSDGSFGMNLNELATAVSQNLPLVIVILNNGVLGMVRQWQGLFYEKRFSQTTLQRKTNFAQLARAFGAEGATATSLDELHALLTNLPDACPLVIDCHIDADERVLPMIPPGGSVKDIIID